MWEYSLRRKKVAEIRDDGPVSSPDKAAELLLALGMHELEQEHLIAIALNVRHGLRGVYTVTIGLVDRAQSHAREVYRNAILMGASKLVLAHNHPSGDPSPSTTDISTTREMVEAGKIVGISVIDHIIMGDPDRTPSYVSFREQNLL